jgi:hypothetical protein
MVHLNYDEYVNHNFRVKQIVIGIFCFIGFWSMAGFMAASLLSNYWGVKPN